MNNIDVPTFENISNNLTYSTSINQIYNLLNYQEIEIINSIIVKTQIAFVSLLILIFVYMYLNLLEENGKTKILQTYFLAKRLVLFFFILICGYVLTLNFMLDQKVDILKNKSYENLAQEIKSNDIYIKLDLETKNKLNSCLRNPVYIKDKKIKKFEYNKDGIFKCFLGKEIK